MSWPTAVGSPSACTWTVPSSPWRTQPITASSRASRTVASRNPTPRTSPRITARIASAPATLPREALQSGGTQEGQRFGVRRPGRSGVHDHPEVAALYGERVAVERDLPDLGMVEGLAARRSARHGALAPELGEHGAGLEQVPDQIVQMLVAEEAAERITQLSHGGRLCLGLLLRGAHDPRPGSGELTPGHGALATRGTGPVPRSTPQRAGSRPRSRSPRRPPAPEHRRGDRAGGAGSAVGAILLQARQVVDGDAGEVGHLLAAQTRHAALGTGGQPGVGRGEALPPGPEAAGELMVGDGHVRMIAQPGGPEGRTIRTSQCGAPGPAFR